MGKIASVREASIEDTYGIWKICSQYFDEFSNSEFDDFKDLFIYRWQNNPSRTVDHPLGWVLVNSDNEIKGFLGLVPMKYKVKNYDLISAAMTTFAVDVAYRAYSLILIKKVMSWGDKHFLIDCTSGDALNMLYSKLKVGMNKIPITHFDERFFWILEPNELARWKLKSLEKKNKFWELARTSPIKNMAYFLSYIRFYKNRKIKFKPHNLKVESVDFFTDEFDKFWEDNKKHYGITIVRKEKFLTWRHMNIPKLAGRSCVFACREKGSLMGYIAIQKRGYLNSKPGHFIVTDIFYRLDRNDVFYSLVNYAFEFAANNCANMFEISGFNPLIMDKLKTQTPFIMKSSKWTYWFKAREQALLELCRNEIWWPSGVDGDLNF